MRDYIIMSDSCCDLSAQEISELGLVVLPMTFTIDGEVHQDTPDRPLPLHDFYTRVRGGALCSTAALNVGEFTDAMKKVLDEGKDVLYAGFSGGMSTTYQSACIAAADLCEHYPDARILVVDTLSATRGQGMLLYRAVQERRSRGLDIEAMAEYIRALSPSINQWTYVEDLAQLKRGGRISGATALAGTALGIKPILTVNGEGKLVSAGKARGSKAALAALADKVGELGTAPLSEQTVFIGHADCGENAALLAQLLRERYGITDIHTDYVGPVIGSHLGWGGLTIFFEGEAR